MNMNKVLLTLVVAATSAASAPAAAQTAKAEVKVAKAVKTEVNTASDDMKDVKINEPTLGVGFRMNAFFINAADRKTTELTADANGLNLITTKGENKNVLSVYPVVDLIGKFDSKYARGKVTLEARLMKDNDNNKVIGHASDALYIDETFVNLGSEDGVNMDIGFCDSAATYVFSSNSKYYRGPGKGLFGDAARYMIWANKIDNKIAGYTDKTATTSNKDNEVNSRTYPSNWMYMREYIAGDDWTYQPRFTLWLPKMVRGAHTVEVGVGSTLTTESQDGVFFTAGASYDYAMSNTRKIRLAVAGGISAQTDEKLSNYEYKRPAGVAAGVSYHSDNFDAGIKFIYNHESYAWKLNDATINTLKTAGMLNDKNQPSYNVTEGTATTAYKYVEKDSTGPMTVSLRLRMALANDWDMTAGAYFAGRNTGIVKNQDSDAIWEKTGGVSLGVNGPIGETGFRMGLEASYILSSNEARPVEASARGVTKVNTVDSMFIAGVGVSYAK